MPTNLATFSLNVIGSANAATEIAAAPAGCRLRVVVRVLAGPAGASATLASTISGLGKPNADGGSSSGFSIPNGSSETFILDCGEQIYAVGNMAGVSVSVATSEIVNGYG